MLYKTLCTHPDIAFLHGGMKKHPESPRLGDWLSRMGIHSRTPKEAHDFWNRYRDGKRDVMTADHAPPEAREWYPRVIDGMTRAMGCTRFVAKLPGHTVRVPWLRAVFPNALFLIACRDWRAVVASTVVKREKKHGGQDQWWGVFVPGWGKQRERPMTDAAAYVYRVAIEILEQAEAEAPERFLRVQYAQLCSDPRGEMHRIAEFAGLPWPAEFEASLPTELPNSNYKWKDALTPEVIERIRAAEGPLLDRYTEEALAAHPA